MGKELWKPGNMVYPLPAVMVSCADKEGHDNIITIAWTGTICTNPAMLYISVRPTRYSYHLIRESGEFVVNLTTKDLVSDGLVRGAFRKRCGQMERNASDSRKCSDTYLCSDN